MSEPEISIEDFLDKALLMAKRDDEAKKVLALSKGETIQSPFKDNKPPPEYVRAVRFHSINVIFNIWNEQVKSGGEGIDIYIGDVVKPVQEKVRFLISIGAWKFGIPGELTIRRRVEEAALPKYYPETGKPAIVSIGEPGYYRPSPYYLSPQTRQAMHQAIKASEILT